MRSIQGDTNSKGICRRNHNVNIFIMAVSLNSKSFLKFEYKNI